MNKTNQYKGVCRKCGYTVKPGEGFLKRAKGKRFVEHQDCNNADSEDPRFMRDTHPFDMDDDW